MNNDLILDAFENELEKIAARVPRRFLKGPNPFREGTEAHRRVYEARKLRNFSQAMGSSDPAWMRRTGTTFLDNPFRRDRGAFRRPSRDLLRSESRHLRLAELKRKPVVQKRSLSERIKAYLTKGR